MMAGVEEVLGRRDENYLRVSNVMIIFVNLSYFYK